MQPDKFSALEFALVSSAEALIAGRGGDEGRFSENWEEALVALTGAASRSVPGAAYVGMTLRDPDGRLHSRAASHVRIIELDQDQARLGQGPCVDALDPRGVRVVCVDDFTTETRWPEFAAAATRAGMGSLLSYGMAPHRGVTGAVNFYSPDTASFDDPVARALAGAFAMQAALAIYGASRIAALTRGLENRDRIGQAKGILMERFHVDADDAFRLLVSTSQDTNVKLLEVARWLAADVGARARPTGGSPSTP